MEELQATLQSVLSDPARMAQIAALAESLGLKPPEQEAGNAAGAAAGRPPEAGGGGMPNAKSKTPTARAENPDHSEDGEGSASQRNEASILSSLQMMGNGIDLPGLLSGLSALNGSEERVLNALRPSLGPAGQAKADRALRAAKLARLGGQLLRRGREDHV